MAKNSIRDYSATASQNTDINSINIDENCPASNLNNSQRALMAHLKDVSTGAVNLETPAVDQLNFGDNAKAIFGAGNDLQIYHDGNNSYVEDAGSGYLVLKGSDPGIALQNSSATNLLLTGTNDVSLLFSGNSKLTTTNTGVDVTGGLDVQSTSGTTTDIGTFEAAVGSYTGTSLVAANTLGPASTYNLFKCVTDSDGDAGGPFTEFVIRGDGKVGIGTSSPAVEAHIQTSSGNPELRIESTGANYASMSLKNSSRTYSTQIRVDQNNAYTIRDETAGANRFLITSSGDVLIGSASNVGIGKMSIDFSRVTNTGIELKTDGTGATRMLKFRNPNGTVGEIVSETASTTYATSSDYRLKENVTDMTGAIDRVKALAPKRFTFIADADTTVDGFLAHEAQAVVPEAVTGTKDEVDDDGNAVMQGIDQSKLVPLLTGALQEAIAKIETLETEMTALKARVTALEA